MTVLLESAVHSATFWTAVAAVGAVFTLFLIYKQIASARDVSAYQFLRSEGERFESPGMARIRSNLARALITYSGKSEKIDDYAEEVCGYFEDLGLMLRKGITPKYFTWTMYYDYIVTYWPLLQSYVRRLRTGSGDSTYYCEFEYLYGKMVELQRRTARVEKVEPLSAGDLRDFLESELQVDVRPFRLADLAGVMEIERCSFDVDAYPKEQFRMLYEGHSQGFLVAEMLGRLVGYIVSYAEGPAGRIDSMAVHPHDRRLGIARKLLLRALDHLQEMAATSCSLEVRTTNTSATSLYEHLGFKKQETIPKYYEDGADAYRMIKTQL
jgi:ribosomal-protein-alanine N-acetyltransferase